jgi:Family of unknown function (DUF6152)
MNTRLSTVSLVTIVLLLAAYPMLAHHSNAVFDHEHLTVITGTVTRFAFINSHAQIYLNVDDDKGKVVEWTVTGTTPAAMRRLGWTSNMFKPGEQLTITGMAYRDGRPIMINLKIVRANGQEVRIGATEQGFYDAFLKQYGNDPKRRSQIGKVE